MGARETQDEVLERARRAYREACGTEPVWGAVAPGRVNLIGDHTDYTGGLAMPMAVDLWCAAVGGPAREAGRVRIVSADRGEGAVLEWAEGESGVLGEAVGRLPRGHWARYAAGVMAECEAAGAGVPRMDVAVAGSVPIGSGLSSSAALEVAVATLVEEAAGVRLRPLEKARVCQRAEHVWAGVKCGLMDQMCSVMGREGHALLMDFAEVAATPVAMPADVAVIVADSGVRRGLGEGAYGRIVEECERAREALGVGSLREVRVEEVEGIEGRLERGLARRVRHVVMENRRVEEAAAALRAGDVVRFGTLMVRSHESLRDEFGVSCGELDAMVEILTDGASAGESGVYGARMTGAGFGGCIVAAVAPWAVEDAVARLTDEYRRRCGRACDVYRVRASGGARGARLG